MRVNILPGLVLAAAAALAFCALLFARHRVARPLARGAIVLAILVVPASVVSDWDAVSGASSKATALGMLISHVMNFAPVALLPITLAGFAIKRSAASRKNVKGR